jgi:hypothetical protein
MECKYMNEQVFRAKHGAAHPDKQHPWGAIQIRADGAADLCKSMWFGERSKAVDYAKLTFGNRYAIARAWGEHQNPNAFQQQQ